MANPYLKSMLLAGTIIGSSLALAPAAFAQASASPYTSAQRFDAAGRVAGTISADPDGSGPLLFRATRNTYDAAGRLTKVERGTLSSWQSEEVAPADWSGFTVYEVQDIAYDALDRKVKETLSGGGSVQAATQYSYDVRGQLECVAVRMNAAAFGSLPASACDLGSEGSFGPDRITKNSYDAAGQLTKVTEAFGTPVQADEVTNSYTLNGKLETLTDGENNRTTYEYDGHDRHVKVRFPVPAQGAQESSASDYEQYAYDANGNRTSFRNRANEWVNFSYDALNRMKFKDLPQDGLIAGTEDISYAYDLLGRMKSASRQGHAVTFTYDALGRKLTEGGQNGTVVSAYDSAGRRTRLTYPDGFKLDYTYLDTGEMKEIKQPGSTMPSVPDTVLITFGYDDLGRRTSIARLNGAATSYSYDAVSRLSQLVQNPAGTAHDLTLDFSYNPASQIASNTRSNDTYAWAGHGNGTTSSPANGLNQLASHGGTSLGYDAKGNLLSDPHTGYTFAYSAENLLTTVYGPGWTGTLRYDPLMRLLDSGANGRTRFVYDGDTRIAEYSSSGAQLYRFVHGAGVDEPLIEYDMSLGTRRFLHADERGSIVALSRTDGTVSNVNRYDEYGKPAGSNRGRFLFTGYPIETMTELYYARARFYNYKIGGRFMQPDPIGYVDGPNAYIYSRADPVNMTDPSGNVACCNDSFNPDDDQATKLGELGTEIARSPSKVDDAVLFGTVGILAAGTVAAVVSAPLFTVSATATAEAGTGGAAAAGAGMAAPGVTSVTGSIAARAANSLRAPTLKPKVSMRNMPQPARNTTASTGQPDRVPRAYSGERVAERARRGQPAPRTGAQKAAEALRAVFRILSPFD